MIGYPRLQEVRIDSKPSEKQRIGKAEVRQMVRYDKAKIILMKVCNLVEDVMVHLIK